MIYFLQALGLVPEKQINYKITAQTKAFSLQLIYPGLVSEHLRFSVCGLAGYENPYGWR